MVRPGRCPTCAESSLSLRGCVSSQLGSPGGVDAATLYQKQPRACAMNISLASMKARRKMRRLVSRSSSRLSSSCNAIRHRSSPRAHAGLRGFLGISMAARLVEPEQLEEAQQPQDTQEAEPVVRDAHAHTLSARVVRMPEPTWGWDRGKSQPRVEW
eukprot:3771098-Prymnesium_polylepis.5